MGKQKFIASGHNNQTQKYWVHVRGPDAGRFSVGYSASDTNAAVFCLLEHCINPDESIILAFTDGQEICDMPAAIGQYLPGAQVLAVHHYD